MKKMTFWEKVFMPGKNMSDFSIIFHLIFISLCILGGVYIGIREGIIRPIDRKIYKKRLQNAQEIYVNNHKIPIDSIEIYKNELSNIFSFNGHKATTCNNTVKLTFVDKHKEETTYFLHLESRPWTCAVWIYKKNKKYVNDIGKVETKILNHYFNCENQQQ